MRIFYIFKINNEIVKQKSLTEKDIYESLENIYLMDESTTKEGKEMLEVLTNYFDKFNINTLIKEIYRNNINYTNFGNVHTYYDFFTGEKSKIYIYNTHIKIKSNKPNPIFLNDIKNIKNLFVCDFINIDYFFVKKFISLV